MTPGQKLLASAEGATLVDNAEFKRDLRWREGFIEFENEPLGTAIAEYNRYTLVPILIEDERVSEQRISGVFRTARPEGLIDVVSEILPVAVQRSEEAITILWAGSQ
jgi:transmembrane sensor